MKLSDHVKPAITDKEIASAVTDEDLTQYDLTRVYAVDKVFTRVVFKQCNITSCYFRNCRFVGCDFTGALIKDTNLKGSQFEDCKFLYSSWEKTHLEGGFLDNCLPSEENLARDLVRSLRVNFAQVGNYEAVNKAASIEVKLTGKHLYNAAYSRQSYYRRKYKGAERLRHALLHARWKALDLLWGNGESIWRVLGWGLAVIACFAAALWLYYGDYTVAEALQSAVELFWGARPARTIHSAFAVPLTVARFVLFGLFMAILVKRLSRR